MDIRDSAALVFIVAVLPTILLGLLIFWLTT